MNKNNYEVIIIGAGPAGLFCATNINKKTLLIDANNEVGGKIKVSGAGRCNVCNNKDVESFLKSVHKNEKFLYPTFNNFSPFDIINYFQNNKIKLKEEEENKMFLASGNSQELIDFFNKQLNSKDNVALKLNCLVESIEIKNNKFIINNIYECNELVIATGGVSYPHISQGYQMHEQLKKLDIDVTDLLVASSPLVVSDEIISSKKLQGISLRKPIGNLYINGKKKKTLQKDIIITHFGLSGPLALDLSGIIQENLMKKSNVELQLIIKEDIPNKIKKYLTDDSIKFKISDVKGFKTAFLTNGGVSLKQINPQTLESKDIPNLYFAGEVLDINAITGGYNIGICLSEGKLIAETLNKK